MEGLVAYKTDAVSLKALAFGLLLNMRYIVFFLIVWR